MIFLFQTLVLKITEQRTERKQDEPGGSSTSNSGNSGTSVSSGAVQVKVRISMLTKNW